MAFKHWLLLYFVFINIYQLLTIFIPCSNFLHILLLILRLKMIVTKIHNKQSSPYIFFLELVFLYFMYFCYFLCRTENCLKCVYVEVGELLTGLSEQESCYQAFFPLDLFRTTYCIRFLIQIFFHQCFFVNLVLTVFLKQIV